MAEFTCPHCAGQFSLTVNLSAEHPSTGGRPRADAVNLSPGQLTLWGNTDPHSVSEHLYHRVQADPGALY